MSSAAPIQEDQRRDDMRRDNLRWLKLAPPLVPGPIRFPEKKPEDNRQNDLWRCIYVCLDGTNGHMHGTLKQCIRQVKKFKPISISFVKGDLRKVGV